MNEHSDSDRKQRIAKYKEERRRQLAIQTANRLAKNPKDSSNSFQYIICNYLLLIYIFLKINVLCIFFLP